MSGKLYRFGLGLMAAALCVVNVGCGSVASSSGNSGTPAAQTGTVNMMVDDATTEDWATIGVKILSISLQPQGGGAPVNVYTAMSPAPVLNLVQLDQLSEILGSFSVPVGTYTGAILTVSANPGDVTLTTAADPEPGFAGAANTTIPTNQTDIQGATGSAGSLTTPVSVNFVSPLMVTANSSNAVDLEFDLSHPAFIVGHVPPTAQGTVMWAINFKGPLRHHPIEDITRLVLRHFYGNVTAVSPDDTTLTVTKAYPVFPVASPATARASLQSLPFLADATNGTIYYDVDAKTSTVINNFSSIASSIVGKFVRVAARYQSNGSLVAVRVWASTSFNSLYVSPEGHLLHVNKATDVITVSNEIGLPVKVTVDANTQFFFRTPSVPKSDATPIGTGTGFLTSGNLVRGFKVHVSVVDPLAVPLVAQTVDIETAAYDGYLSNATTTSFLDTRTFNTPGDNYSLTLSLISSTTANGKDANGNAIQGFKWWYFTFPTQLNYGAAAVSNFASIAGGAASFGGTAAPVKVWGESLATWNDPANPNGWAIQRTALEPAPLALGSVASGWSAGTSSGSFTMTVPGGANAVTVNLNTVSGSAALVYQVDRTNGIVTVSAVDITTAAGQATISTNLIAGTPVAVFGVPQANGSIQAYVLVFFTGVKPTAAAEVE